MRPNLNANFKTHLSSSSAANTPENAPSSSLSSTSPKPPPNKKNFPSTPTKSESKDSHLSSTMPISMFLISMIPIIVQTIYT